MKNIVSVALCGALALVLSFGCFNIVTSAMEADEPVQEEYLLAASSQGSLGRLSNEFNGQKYVVSLRNISDRNRYGSVYTANYDKSNEGIVYKSGNLIMYTKKHRNVRGYLCNSEYCNSGIAEFYAN